MAPQGILFFFSFLHTTNPVTSSWNKRVDIISDLISHCLIWPCTFPLSAFFFFFLVVSSGMIHGSKWPLHESKNLPFLGRIPVQSIRVFVARRRNHVCVLQCDLNGGWGWGGILRSPSFLLGFYRLWAHIFSFFLTLLRPCFPIRPCQSFWSKVQKSENKLL